MVNPRNIRKERPPKRGAGKEGPKDLSVSHKDHVAPGTFDPGGIGPKYNRKIYP